MHCDHRNNCFWLHPQLRLIEGLELAETMEAGHPTGERDRAGVEVSHATLQFPVGAYYTVADCNDSYLSSQCLSKNNGTRVLLYNMTGAHSSSSSDPANH
jgi:hypothetical protein